MVELKYTDYVKWAAICERSSSKRSEADVSLNILTRLSFMKLLEMFDVTIIKGG